MKNNLQNEYADLVFLNGAIYTVDSKRSWAQSVAISEGKIIYVGDQKGIESFIGPDTDIKDLKGKMMMPGFHDTHVHLISGGMQENECTLNDLDNLNDVLKRIEIYSNNHSLGESEWINCSGLDKVVMDNLTKKKLDAISADRPLTILTFDGHSLWANSRAMELGGINETSINPSQGEIVRLSNSNIPSGLFHDAATLLIKNVIPKPSFDERVAGLRTGMKLAHQFGITSIIEPGLDDELIAPYQALSDQNELLLNVRASISPINWEPGAFGDEIYDFVNKRQKLARKNIDVNSVKIYIDGVLENGSAVLLEPNLIKELNGNLPFYTQAALNEYITWIDKQGIQVHLHAIGDGGIRMSLDA